MPAIFSSIKKRRLCQTTRCLTKPTFSAKGGTRTLTPVKVLDPKSSASANSATLARGRIIQNEPFGFREKMFSSADLSKYLLVLLIFISACSPPIQIATVSGRLEALPDVEEPTPSTTAEKATENQKPRYPIVNVGKFDDGKMWTFENAPTEYFKSTYNIEVDSSWYNKARLGALRFASYCSASLVSNRGLVMTNHHCARESVTKVQKDGENLLDNGFYAEADSLERKVKDLYVQQLIAMEDVTDEVLGAAENVPGAGPKAEARRKRAEAIENRVNQRLKSEKSAQTAEVVELYSGGRYMVYTYRKYDDVRLVLAPELEIGYFGGDTDNFTYPRHTLDVSFFRIWTADTVGVHPDHFTWSTSGIEEGDPVFVVGNPGSTSRLKTTAQLEYERDVELPGVLEVLDDRIDILHNYVASNRAQADSFNVRNDLMSARNSQKALRGQFEGLQLGEVISRTYSAEQTLSQSISVNSILTDKYGSVIRDIELLQESKKASAKKAAAFYQFLNPSVSSHILARAMYGYVYTILRQRGAPPEQLKEIVTEAKQITSWPKALESQIIAARLRDFATYLGPNDPTMKRLLGTRSVEQLADSVANYSVLSDSTEFRKLLEGNYLTSKDVSVGIIGAIAPLYFTLDQELRAFQEREDAFMARLAMAQFEVNGSSAPPDATFTLRLADGVVAPYSYKGEEVAAFTRIEGMYAMHEQNGDAEEWSLPESWLSKQSTIPQDTPLNLFSTNDITGGNSGSPLLNKDLEVVGLVFDGNLQSLPNEYVYDDVAARTVSVDARAILVALKYIYQADRLVGELQPTNN